MDTLHTVDITSEIKGHGRTGTAQRLTGQFGELDETEIGTDLTLEWDSNDPDLHAHLAESVQEGKDDAADFGWNVDEMGIPDA
jgi:hypothetical protein